MNFFNILCLTTVRDNKRSARRNMTPDILSGLLVLFILLKNTVPHPLSVEREKQRASFTVNSWQVCYPGHPSHEEGTFGFVWRCWLQFIMAVGRNLAERHFVITADTGFTQQPFGLQVPVVFGEWRWGTVTPCNCIANLFTAKPVLPELKRLLWQLEGN